MKNTSMVFTRRRSACLIISYLGTGLAFSAPVLEEVLVTAQKREQSLQDVPITLSAYTAENLKAFGVTGTQSLQSITPGLVFSNTGAIAQPYLRGVGTRASINGLESSIATYIDGRYVARSSATLFDFADIERVEVLKGPQGTLYGRNATGGAIRVVTKDVSDDLAGTLSGTAGNFAHYSLSATLSGPLSESLGGRITVLNTRRDGYVKNLVPGAVPELDDQDFQAYRSKLKWDINDIWFSDLSLGYWTRDDTASSDQVDLSPPGLNVGVALGGYSGQSRNEAATAIGIKNRGDEFSAELNVNAHFDTVDFVSVTTFSDFDQLSAVDGDGTSATVVDAYFDENESAISQEIQLLSNSSEKVEWLVGAYYYDGKAEFDGTLNAGLPSRLSQSLQSVDTRAWAVFGQSTYRFSEAWAVTAGGRWSDEKKAVYAQSSKIAPITVIPVPFSDSESWDEFTPKLTLEYSFDDSLLYLSYARGFKSGGFNYPASGSPVLDPETLDMLEIGLKSDLFENQLRLNASGYFYDYSGLQVTRSAGAGSTPRTENAADSEVLGLDIDATWLVNESLTLTAGLNVLDTEYKNYDANAKRFNANITGNPAAPGMSDTYFKASGESLLRAPNWSAFASIQYQFTLANASIPIALSYAYKDDYNFDFIADSSSAPLRQEAFGLVNTRVSYIPNGQQWSFSFWANNLSNTKYFDDVVANVAGIRGSWGAPRTYGIDVDYEF